MADDLKVGIAADTSALKSGLADAQAQVRDASARMAEAQEAFGKSAAQGNAQAAEALKLYQAELRSAEQALAALTGTQEKQTIALRESVSSTMAATAEMRVLSGSISGADRAAGVFLSTLPGIGPAMQSAFAVFGVVALVEILGQAAGAVGKLISAYRDLDGAAIKASTDAIIAGEKIVSIKPSFDSNAIARIVAGAGLQPDVTVQNASAALKQIEYARQLQDAQAAVNEQGKTGVALQQQRIADAQKEVEFARESKAQADALVEAYRKQLEAKTTIVTEIPTKNRMVVSKQEINTITDPKQVEAIQGQLKEAVAAAQEFGHQIDMAQVKLEGAKLKLPAVDDKAAEKAGREAQEAADKASRAWDEAWRHINGSSQSRVARAWDEAQKEMTRGITEGSKQLQESERESTRWSAQVSEDVMRTGEKWDSYREAVVRGEEVQAQMSAQLAEARIQFQQATGQIGAHAAALRLAAIHADEYAQKLAVLKQRLADLQKSQTNDPVTGVNTDPENARKQQDIQNQIAQVQGQGQVSSIKSQAAQAEQMAQPWIEGANTVANAWGNAFNQIVMYGNQHGKAILGAEEAMVSGLLSQTERWLIKKLDSYILDAARHALGQTQKTTQTATANATIQADTVTTNVAAALSYAAVAAAGAASSVAAIPIVGAAMAPVAAATTYADTSTWAATAAYDTGGIIPRDGVIMAHEKEAVLPRHLTEFLMNAAGGGSQSGSASRSVRDINLHYNGGRTSGPGDMMHQLERTLRRMNLTT